MFSQTKREGEKWGEEACSAPILKAQQALAFNDLRAEHALPLGFKMEEKCSDRDSCSERERDGEGMEGERERAWYV